MRKFKTQNSKLKIRNAPLALMLTVFGVYLLTMSGHTYSTDEETMLAASRSLVEQGTWAINPSDSWVHIQGADGRHYSVFGPGQSFAAVPWVAAGLVAGNLFPKNQAGFPLRLILASYNALISAGICGLLAATGMAIGYARRASLALGGTLAFATFLWPHSRTFFAEPLVALCLLASFYLIIKCSQTDGRARFGPGVLLLISGALFAAELMVKVQYAVALPAFLLYLLLKSYCSRPATQERPTERDSLLKVSNPKSNIAYWLGGLVAGLIPLVLYDWVIFGNPLQTGYGGDVESLFNTPLYEGAFGLLLSPGKGLLWYALPIVLAIVGFKRFARKRRPEAIFVLALGVSLASFFGLFHLWWGGGSWGPRFLVPLVPFALLPALPILQRATNPTQAANNIKKAPINQNSKLNRTALAVSIVITAGFLINLAGVLVNFDTYVNSGEDDDTRNWSPPASPIGGQFSLLGQRLKLRDGIISLLKPQDTLFLKSGFSYSEATGERREPLPRWTTGNGAIEFRPNLSKGTVIATIRLSDNRPPQMPRAVVTFMANDKLIAVETAPVKDAPVSTDYSIPLTASPTRVEIRSDTWNPATSGAGPRNEDLGVRLESISVAEGGVPHHYDIFETLPVPAYYPQPRWYYNTDTLYPADLWFVYMAEMGVGRKAMLAIAAPIALLSIVCLLLGFTGLRAGRQSTG